MMHRKRMPILLLCLLLAAAFVLPAGALAGEAGAGQAAPSEQTAPSDQTGKTDQADKAEQAAPSDQTGKAGQAEQAAPSDQTGKASRKGTIVRVGWYDSSFNTRDENGRRTGYAYEYQLKVAAHTGWTYEYVSGSWSDLMDMLRAGDIDMMSDVSYTEERAEEMLFPDLPMGTEEYYLFTSPKNKTISSDDFSTLNGKRVGVNKDSIQEGYFLEWEKQHGVNAKLVRQTCPEEESLRMLALGRLDAYITPDAFGDPEHLVPVCKIGSSDFYFAISKKRPELLTQLNQAMSKIQDENRFYNHEMSDKYVVRSGVNAYLTSDEDKWLSEHGTIRVGYQDDYLAFCARDEATGELTGTLKDYLEFGSEALKNAKIDFAPKPYPTAEAALKALNEGEVDCVFPANLSGYDGETMNLVMTPPLMRTEILAVVRPKERSIFDEKDHVVVAVNKGNTNYDSFLLDHFPDWRAVYYSDTEECLKAVSDGVADCVLISNYRFNNIARECAKYGLTTIDAEVELDYSFAVNRGDTQLYSILSRISGLVPSSVINTSLSYYSTEDARIPFREYLEDHVYAVIIIVSLLLLIILFLMARSMRAEKKSKRLIAATEIDDLTGLYNRDYFLAYAERLHKADPDKPMDAIVLNIEQFHSVNALSGRNFGDRVLRILGSEVRAVARENGGIAGRFGADRFDIYCRHTEDYQAIFDRLQNKLDEVSPHASIRLRMGVMAWQDEVEIVMMFDRARTACNMSRGHYSERLIVFNDDVRERELLEQRLLTDQRRALDSYEFEVHYQPKFDIRSDVPVLVSAEALVRWRHPELGMIPPVDFVPLFERYGIIGEVDKYVWSEAARQIVRWRELFGRTIPISVNLSRVDVFDLKLEETLDGVLDYHGIDHDNLMLEVTESAYTENSDQLVRVVRGLRSKGYLVEMDDFGTGYSSLNMLSEMPVDVLKMDRAFIKDIENGEKGVQLVRLILDIAKTLDIPVVAEGVETESQLERLKDLGCSYAQGYYFSPPLTPSEFEREIIQKYKGR